MMHFPFLLFILGISIFSRCTAQYDNYDIHQLIGNGASALVYRVQNKLNGQFYAMKAVRKSYIAKNAFYRQIQTERDILASNRSPLTLRLLESFSDDTYLYFVTELCTGGDLMSLIMTEDTFSEDIARFYIAEIILGVEYLHAKSITMRDLKFENILIADNGHLKLADFGLATLSLENRYDSSVFLETMQLDKLRNARRLSGSISRSNSRANPRAPTRPGLGTHRRSQTSVPRLEHRGSQLSPFKPSVIKSHQRKFHSILGTIDYVAYEVWDAEGYSSACDLWSIGVIFFEMLLGYPTFSSETVPQTVHKIRNFQEHLQFLTEDPSVKLSQEAISLIKGLICKEEDRLTIPQIKAHPFFAHIVDWSDLLQATMISREDLQQRNYNGIRPPFIPKLREAFNHEYFPIEDLVSVAEKDAQTFEGQDMATFWNQRKGTMMADVEEVFSEFRYIAFLGPLNR